MKKQKVLVTGATGFVGSQVIERLIQDPSIHILAGVRVDSSALSLGVEQFVIGDLGDSVCASMAGIDSVIHCAARVHVMDDTSTDPLQEFRRVNVQGTLDLARRAADAGVTRFIFISSVKVNGESTEPGHPFAADDTPAPVDPYGISKFEAEQALIALADETKMAVVIIRPVLIYGPGVKANFLSMMKWLHRRVPLPLGAIHNRRSLLSIENLVDLITVCMRHPKAVNQVFLASDDEDLSSPELLRRTAAALRVKAILLPVPESLIRFSAKLLRLPHVAARLCGSLQVDIGKTKTLLEWTPPVSVEQALGNTARHYLDNLKV